MRATGFPLVVMPSGRMSVRTIDAVQLYSDPRHAVAVTDIGTVLDLEVETDDMKTVKMNESYQNDGVEYRVLSDVSSKKLVNIERTDRKYYYDEKIFIYK